MKRINQPISILSAAVFALICAAFLSCGGCSGRVSSESAELTSYTDTVYAPKYASGFTVTAPVSDGDKPVPMMLTVKNPWQGAEGIERRLLILPEGAGASMVPDGFKGGVIEGAARRIVAMSSTHVAMLDAIGAADYIAGVSGLDYISSSKVAARKAEIADVGYEGNIDWERLVGAAPDLVLLYGVNSASSMEEKLDELHIPYIYIGDYLEESPLGKAEWMNAIGVITGLLPKAEAAFEPVENSYLATVRKVREAIGGNGGADSASGLPAVMINAPSGDNWFMPPAGTYISRIIRDAGGRLVYAGDDGTVSRSIDMEMAWNLMRKADFWLNPGAATDMKSLMQIAPRMNDTPPVQRGNVWNNNALQTRGGGNDFYESGTVRPDLVLRDIVGILHPELADSLREPVYYRRMR